MSIALAALVRICIASRVRGVAERVHIAIASPVALAALTVHVAARDPIVAEKTGGRIRDIRRDGESAL